MNKGLTYLISAVLIAALGWFGYHWHRAPNARATQGMAQAGAVTPARDAPAAAKSAPAGAAAPGAQTKSAGAAKGKSRGGPVSVSAERVAAHDVEERVTAVGTILAAQSVLIKPEIEGRVANIAIADGARVKAGDLLFKLDGAVIDAELAQARAELSLAFADLKRTRNLANKNFVSERSRDEASSRVAVLKARLQVVQARQSKTLVSAPFDGIAGLINVHLGDYVKAGAELVRLDDLSTLRLDIRVAERLLAKVQRGQTIRVRSDAYPAQSFVAIVETIDTQLDRVGRAVVVRARIDNTRQLLRPGMFARASLVVAKRDAALMVSEECIVPDSDGSYVYRIDAGKAHKTKVITGVRQDGKVEVVEGLTLGDQVVSAGQIKLTGKEVAVRVIGAASKSAQRRDDKS